LATPPAPCAIRLRAEYDGYGTFFTVDFADIEYVEFSPGVVEGIEIADLQVALRTLGPKWSRLVDRYSGPTFICEMPLDVVAEQTFEHRVIVANTITVQAGPDWDRLEHR